MFGNLSEHLAHELVTDRLRETQDHRRAAELHEPLRVRDGDALERVVPAAAAHDDDAWGVLVRRFTARVSAVARAYRLNADDTEDVMQMTWLRLLEHIDSVRTPAAVGAWLETTARRESLRIVTRPREQPVDEAATPGPAVHPDPCDELLRAELRGELDRAVERLPARQQQLIRMMASEAEPTYTELSDALRMPVGSIGPTRARSLRRLRGDPRLASAAGLPE